MAAARLDELMVFQEAVALRRGVYQLVGRARRPVDLRWRSQLFDAVLSVESNIAEGWARSRHGEMAQFLRYAHGSLDEAWCRLVDGADRGYYTRDDLTVLRIHERRCGSGLRRLRVYLESTPTPPH